MVIPIAWSPFGILGYPPSWVSVSPVNYLGQHSWVNFLVEAKQSWGARGLFLSVSTYMREHFCLGQIVNICLISTPAKVDSANRVTLLHVKKNK